MTEQEYKNKIEPLHKVKLADVKQEDNQLFQIAIACNNALIKYCEQNISKARDLYKIACEKYDSKEFETTIEILEWYEKEFYKLTDELEQGVGLEVDNAVDRELNERFGIIE